MHYSLIEKKMFFIDSDSFCRGFLYGRFDCSEKGQWMLMYVRDYLTLHLDINYSKETASSEKGQ